MPYIMNETNVEQEREDEEYRFYDYYISDMYFDLPFCKNLLIFFTLIVFWRSLRYTCIYICFQKSAYPYVCLTYIMSVCLTEIRLVVSVTLS